MPAPSTVAVLELEPQTLWEKVVSHGRWQYRLNEAQLDSVAAYPQATLLHGIGQPVGGSTDDPVEYLGLLRTAVDRLDPGWVSEHLSFNRINGPAGPEEAGFLLPPHQSSSTVRVAARNVRTYGRGLGRPVAFETGVNYLRPHPGGVDRRRILRRGGGTCRQRHPAGSAQPLVQRSQRPRENGRRSRPPAARQSVGAAPRRRHADVGLLARRTQRCGAGRRSWPSPVN